MATTWPSYEGNDWMSHLIALNGINATTTSTHPLNSAYTYASAGAAACLMSFISPETANLTDIWFKVTAYNGTWASTDGNLNWYVREGLNGSRIPGTTLTGSGTYSTGGNTGWHNITGLTVSLTAGKLYCIIIADADGGATNYATLAVRFGGGDFANISVPECGTTTNGFSTAYSPVLVTGACVAKVGSVVFGGQIWDTISTVASSTNERGNRFRPKEDCTFIGFGVTGDGLSNLVSGHSFKIYADGVNPGGTTLLTYTSPTTTIGGAGSPSPSCVIIPASSRIDLSANTWYRCTFDPVSALTTPRKVTCGGSPDSTLIAASLPFGGDYYSTEESAGAWSDTTSAFYNFGPILVPKTAVTKVFLPSGFHGGING